VRTARGGRSASVITTAALLGALAFPAAAGATGDPEAMSNPEVTSAPEATPAATGTPEPTSAPAAPASAPTASPAPGADPIVVTPPTITVSRTTFAAGSQSFSEDIGWGDGLDVAGTGFTPGSTVVVSLLDGTTEEARTSLVATATGDAALNDWTPASLSDGSSLYPHLPRPDQGITVVAYELRATGGGVAATSNAVELTIVQPAPTVEFAVAEDASRIAAGSEVGVAAFRIYGVVAVLSGFDRDEDVLTSLTAPDGSITSLESSFPQTAIYGEAFVRMDESTMADQLGVFTVRGIGATSGRQATATLVQVADDPGIRIWPTSAAFEPAPADGQPTSGGAIWGFGADERVAVSIHSVDGTRQRLADGGTRLGYTTDAVGWSQIALGQFPLADPETEVYCVVAVGASSGRVASTSYDYGTTEADPIAETADCANAEAAARAGTPMGAGTGSGSGVTAGRPVLAATGVSPAAPLALAASGILGGLALMIMRRRRA
jgi:hypothetical protein